MVALPLRAGEHHVVGDGEGAAAQILADLLAVHQADAGQDAVAGGVLAQVVEAAALALGGDGGLAVFEEGAGIADLGEVLAPRLVAAGVALGDRLGAALVAAVGVALQRLGEVGADPVEVDLLLGRDGVAGVLGGLDHQDRGAVHQGDAGLGHHPADRAGVGGDDDVLHLHRLEHGHLLARADRGAGLDLDGEDGRLHRRRHRALGDRAGGGGGGVLERGVALEEERRGDLGGGGVEGGGLRLDEAGGDRVGLDLGPGEEGAQPGQVGVDALDAELGRGPLGAGEGVGPVGAVDDHLRQQAVEAGGGLEAGVGEAVDAHAGAGRRLIGADRAGGGFRRRRLVHPLHVHAQLDGVALGGGDRRLGQAEVGQRAAPGDLDLEGHEVEAGDGLGHGVFDLDPGIGLDEEDLSGLGVHQEFEGAEGAVVGAGGELQGVGAEGLAGLGRQGRGGGDLDHLLVAALEGALPLAEVDAGAGSVAEHLDLEVAGGGEEALDIDRRVAEGALGLGAAAGPGFLDLGGLAHHAHAAAAAAGDGLDQHRGAVGELVEEGAGALQVGVLGGAGQDRHADLLRAALGGDLVAQQGQLLGRGADEDEAGGLDRAGEGGVLAQEPVAGVHGVGAGGAGGLDDRLGGEVGAGADPAQRVGCVGAADVEGLRVVLGVDGHAFDAEVGGGALDAQGDLAAVGDQKAGDGGRAGGGRGLRRRHSAGSPDGCGAPRWARRGGQPLAEVGSIASRRLSPRVLKASAVARIARPGAYICSGAICM